MALAKFVRCGFSPPSRPSRAPSSIQELICTEEKDDPQGVHDRLTGRSFRLYAESPEHQSNHKEDSPSNDFR